MSSSRRAIPKAWHPKRAVRQIGPLSTAADLSQTLALGTAQITLTPVALGIAATDPPVVVRPRVAWSPAPVTSSRTKPPPFRARSRAILLPAAQSLALGTAVVTVTPVALAVVTGGAAVTLTAATITVTPVALDIAGSSAPSSAVVRTRTAWSSAGLYTNRRRGHAPPRRGVRQIGPVTVAAAPPAQSLALTPATVTVTPVALGLTAGGASLALGVAIITVTPVALAISGAGSPQSIALTAATITVTPVALALSAGAATLALSATTITVSPVALTVAAGAVSVALSPATVTLTAVHLTLSPAVSLTLTVATITVTPVALGIVASAFIPDPNAITLTLTTRAHVSTIAGRHSYTLRAHGHTATVQIEDHSVAARSRGRTVTIQEHR